MRVLFILICALFSKLSAAEAINSTVGAGYEIMTNKFKGNCVACHELPGRQGISSTFGPSLHGVGARLNQEELKQWIVDARKIKPDTLMPPFGAHDGLTAVVNKKNLLDKVQIQQVLNTMSTWR
jgi:sulfur-oxidizing protein SoxX